MKQELNEFFCPIELIEPIAFSNEFQILDMMLVECCRGFICSPGELQ